MWARILPSFLEYFFHGGAEIFCIIEKYFISIKVRHYVINFDFVFLSVYLLRTAIMSMELC